MCKRNSWLPLLIIATITTRASASAEICGNGIDDNGNGYADEGCWPAGALNGLCESPMSCATTGDVAPRTGYLVYRLPPDLNPKVPYGPPLTFQRTYMSGYSPPSTNYRTAMGPHWQHNYMSWLDKTGTSVVVHLVDGRDVLFSYSYTASGYDYYTPQVGFHVQYLRQATSSPYKWQMKTLTGEQYVYNWSSPSGQLIEIDDTLASPNKLLIAYNTSGTNAGQINTITDASGHKQLTFAYTSGEVTSVSYQTVSGGTPTTQVTLSISYTSTNPTTVQLGGSTIQTNSYASGYLTNIQDGGGNNVINIASIAAAPASTASITTGDGVLGFDYNSSNSQCTGGTVIFSNLASTSTCSTDTDCGSTYKCGGKTGSGATGQCFRAARCLTLDSPAKHVTQDATSGWYVPANASEWTTLLGGTGIPNPTQLWLMQEASGNLADSIGSATVFSTGSVSYQQSVTGWSRKAVTTTANGANYFYRFNDSNLGNPGNGPTTLLALVAVTATPSGDRMVMLAGDGNGLKADVTSSDYPKMVVNSAATATGTSSVGTGVRPWLARGDGGLSPTFNKLEDDLETVSPTATRSASSAGAVFFGGAAETAPAAQYLYAASWNTTGLTDQQAAILISRLENGPPSEDLIATATAITPCTGACAPQAQYSWNVNTLDLKGVKRATGYWTSYLHDTNGMTTMMSEGATSDDPTASGIPTWFFYGNSSFPGRVTERRTRSDIQTGTFACDGASNTSGCKRTQYVWNSDGLLYTVENDGYTYNASNSIASFTYVTTNTWDSNGRLTNVQDPLGTNHNTQYVYWSSTDVLKDGYLNNINRQKDSSNYVTTTLDSYDYWGNAQSTQDPDATFTCRTWDTNQNYVSQVRKAMNGQTSCTTTNSLDIVTSYSRDSWLRLTKTTRPLGDCLHQEYDSSGRSTNTKPRDDCTPANSGNTVTRTYDNNGLLSKVEWKDSSSTVTQRAQGSYLDGQQMDGITNPVSGYSRNATYYSDAERNTITYENGLGLTTQVSDAQDRNTDWERYYDGTHYYDWTLAYPTSSPSRIPNQVTDPASKVYTTNYDDLGRRTRVVTPDSGTTIYVYDAGSNLTSIVEAYGSADQATHNFSYDNMHRRLTEDYGSESCSGSNPVEVQYTYDTLPSGVSCPSGASCTRLGGRLAYAKEVLMCTSTSPYHLDQEVFYGYDDAGRLISEEIDDPSPRAVQLNYAWDKNNNMTSVTAPSGASIAYTLGGGSGNSKTNLISSVARSVSGTPTNLITGVQWAPLGPPTQYTQANTIGGTNIQATFTWNLAYRATTIDYSAGSTHKTHVAYTEDEKGRDTQKLYSNVYSGVNSDYLQYDWYDRPTCDATASGSCPTIATPGTLKTNVTAYNSSNDRYTFLHQDANFGFGSYTATYTSGTDQISKIQITGLSTQINYTWDGRGNRTSENDTANTVNQRTYTYDGRRRVRTITGYYPHRYLGVVSMDSYTITYAYDHRDRVVFRQFTDNTRSFSSQTFYNYDLTDRLIEVKFVPVITQSDYTIYDFYWLKDRPVAYWAIAYPGATTSRYFNHTDDANRVIEVFDWPGSGDANDDWSVNPDVFGWDNVVNSSGIFQPFRLNSKLYDDGTISYSSTSALGRPGLLIDRAYHFDSMTESFLQRAGAWPNEPYTRGDHNPNYLSLTRATVPGAITQSSDANCTASRACANCATQNEISVVGVDVIAPQQAGGGFSLFGCQLCRVIGLGTWRAVSVQSSCIQSPVGMLDCFPNWFGALVFFNGLFDSVSTGTGRPCYSQDPPGAFCLFGKLYQ